MKTPMKFAESLNFKRVGKATDSRDLISVCHLLSDPKNRNKDVKSPNLRF